MVTGSPLRRGDDNEWAFENFYSLRICREYYNNVFGKRPRYSLFGMRYTLTERLLLLAADCTDLKLRFTSPSLVGAIPGDPRLYRRHRWMERYIRNQRMRRRLTHAIHNLKRRGYLQEKVLGNSRGYVPSTSGYLKIFPLRLEQSRRRPALPAGQWLLVFFDVPEVERRIRDRLREGLRALGFSPLQRSVWATRRKVGKEVAQLITLLGARAYVKPLLVQNINLGIGNGSSSTKGA